MPSGTPTALTEEQWEQFCRDGFLLLGKVASDDELQAMNTRLDDIMMGRISYGETLLMQLDPNSSTKADGEQSGAAATLVNGADARSRELAAYRAQANETQGQSRDGVIGFKGPSYAYRKIGEAHAGLECDPVFSAFQSKALFHDICGRAYGRHAAISMYRSMVMAKPENELGGGSLLPFHQDGGEWWALDRDPLVFVWTALTPATKENGAVQVVKGSHKRGLLSRRGHTLTTEAVAAVCEAHPEDIIDIELAPGEAALVHNWTVHRSGVNVTGTARRGFSANYIDARTRVLDPKPPLAGPIGIPGHSFPLVWDSPFSPATVCDAKTGTSGTTHADQPVFHM